MQLSAGQWRWYVCCGHSPARAVCPVCRPGIGLDWVRTGVLRRPSKRLVTDPTSGRRERAVIGDGRACNLNCRWRWRSFAMPLIPPDLLLPPDARWGLKMVVGVWAMCERAAPRRPAPTRIRGTAGTERYRRPHRLEPQPPICTRCTHPHAPSEGLPETETASDKTSHLSQQIGELFVNLSCTNLSRAFTTATPCPVCPIYTCEYGCGCQEDHSSANGHSRVVSPFFSFSTHPSIGFLLSRPRHLPLYDNVLWQLVDMGRHGLLAAG